jgi:parallel beta helix pectate lyase-like protein
MARMRTTLVAVTATIAALAAPTTASAITVTDCTQLQPALNNAANSVVTLAEDKDCTGSFRLPQREIVLEGGGDRGATLRGDGDQQILTGDGVGATTIRNLTFIGGLADGELDFERSGGAISLTGSSPVTIEGNDFFKNHADADGGAVSILEFAEVPQPETVEVRGVGPSIVLRDNFFGGSEADANSADDEGGAAYIDTFRNVVVDLNTFEDNIADEDGGGIEVARSSDVALTDNGFSRNTTTDNGGGAAIQACTATVTGNSFDANRVIGGSETSPDGAGLYLSGSLCNSDLQARGGSPIDVVQANNLFLENVIEGNGDGADGGGEHIFDATVHSTNDRFVRNRVEDFSQARGGGLYLEGSSRTSDTFTARNLVATGNQVLLSQAPSRGETFGEARGGGLLLSGNGEGSNFRIEDSTIVDNTASDGSGIAGEFSGGKGQFGIDTLALENSIVFGNAGADNSPQFPLDGEISGFLEREVQFSDFCSEEQTPPEGDGNICEKPTFVPDDDDGDFGEVDQAEGSPTINAGNKDFVDPDLTTDYSLAGDARVIGSNVDMGADEYKPATVQPPPPTTAEPTPPAPAAGGVAGVQQRSCKSKRAFRIRIRVPKGKKALSAVVRVNGKKVKVVRGKRLRAPVRLRGLPKGQFKVRITIRLANGKRISGTRTYHTCIPKLPGDGPPKV